MIRTIAALAILAGCFGYAAKPPAPSICFKDSNNLLCITDPGWHWQGGYIYGTFENSSNATISTLTLKFTLKRADEVITGTAFAFGFAPIPPRGKFAFHAAVSGDGIEAAYSDSVTMRVIGGTADGQRLNGESTQEFERMWNPMASGAQKKWEKQHGIRR